MNPALPKNKKWKEKTTRKGWVKITIKNFQKKIPINPKRAKLAILKVLSKETAKKSGEITVCFVNDKKIRALNLKYRHKDRPTDVLVFELPDPKSSRYLFADVVISTDTAMRNAKIFKTSPLYELNLYLIHGTLHLLGYDDSTPQQKRLMRRKEEEYVHS